MNNFLGRAGVVTQLEVDQYSGDSESDSEDNGDCACYDVFECGKLVRKFCWHHEPISPKVNTVLESDSELGKLKPVLRKISVGKDVPSSSKILMEANDLLTMAEGRDDDAHYKSINKILERYPGLTKPDTHVS